MPKLYMLIGVPGSGKSTWIKNQNFDTNTVVVVSTDDIIEKRALAQGLTYSDVFQAEIRYATTEMNRNLTVAVANNKDIVWDQTNLTVKSRRAKLAQIPDQYLKIAVYFITPDDSELERRLKSRPGKVIPANIVIGMKSQLQRPEQDEGWHEVWMGN
jgi:predicted kinase